MKGVILRTTEDAYEALTRLGVWSTNRDQRELLASKLAGQIEERQVEILFLEARDFMKSENPAAVVQTWLMQARWRQVLEDREKRNAHYTAKNWAVPATPDEDTRGRFNKERIQEERFSAWMKLHPEFDDWDEAKRAFRDRDIHIGLKEWGMAKTCQRWSLTEREVEAAVARYREDQARDLLPGNLKLVDLLPKSATPEPRPLGPRRLQDAPELEAARAQGEAEAERAALQEEPL